MKQSARVSLMKSGFKSDEVGNQHLVKNSQAATPPGCPILRALCDGWDAKAISRHQAVVFDVARSRLPNPLPKLRNRHFDRSCSRLFASSAAEKSASLPQLQLSAAPLLVSILVPSMHRDEKRCHEKYDETNPHHPHMHGNHPFFKTISTITRTAPISGQRIRLR